MKSRLLPITCIIVLTVTAFSHSLNAQDNMKEIGMRLGHFGSDVVFKKEKRPNIYSRYRVGLSNLGINAEGDFILALQLGAAREKRKSIAEKLHFIHGWEFRVGFSAPPNDNLRAGIGHILGFQYEVSEAFLVNVETIPSINVNIDDNDIDLPSSLALDLGVNSSAAISVVYRFQKK